MLDYLDLNHSTYDSLATVYQKKIVEPNHYYQSVAKSICNMIIKQFQIEGVLEDDNKFFLLELGCGVGSILKEMKKYQLLEMYAIDFSDQMVQFAKKNNPNANIKLANILEVDNINSFFGTKLDGKIDILIMAAFIHCFPIKDASSIMLRIKKWLSPNGLVYLDTTDENECQDGAVCSKVLENGEKVKYFRTFWKKKEWNDFINECGYMILSQEVHQDNFGRKWIRTIIRAC